MSVKTVQDAIINTLRTDATVDAEFSTTLTGVVTSVATAVTGVGTAFTSELKASLQDGYSYIGDPTHGYRKVLTIIDDTHLTVGSVFSSEYVSEQIKRTDIYKGMGKSANLSEAGKLLHVVFVASTDMQKWAAGQRVIVIYGFMLAAAFVEPDAEQAEDRKSLYDSMLKNVVEKNFTFGNVCEGNTSVGKYRVAEHPESVGTFYGTMPLICYKQETRGNR